MKFRGKESGVHSLSKVGLSPLYSLDAATICSVVKERRGGVFALLRVSGSEVTALRVERSADDLGRDLVKAMRRSKVHGATHFEFFFVASNAVAVALECRIYHDFLPLLNLRHPPVPVRLGIKCPCLQCPLSEPPSGVRWTLLPDA